MPNRRRFLEALALTGAAATLAARRPVFTAALGVPDVEVVVRPGQPGATIAPHLYGHFIEHLGGVIYDGIWVGRDSRIANVDGIRAAFIDDMKAIGAPNLRWPGGCFADGYHWRNGIGASTKRRRTYNFWQTTTPEGVRGFETNQFGIHEFMRLCQLTGAEPYVAANVGSGTVQEFHEWVDYCNAPEHTLSLADERLANGSPDPFNIQYWGVGNESWGCGGDMTPQEYAQRYRQFVTQFPAHTRSFLVATGPRGHSADRDVGWTRGFFEAMQGGRRSRVDGFSLHFYTDFRQTKFRAATFTPPQWYSVLRKGMELERIILEHWAIMGQFDAEHRTKLVVDEWGNWYPPGEEVAPGFTISQPITLRDGLHTALTFDIFNRHADKIAMANVAQTINCLHALFLAHEDRFVRTPIYYVFKMYRPHMRGELVPIDIGGAEQTVTAEEGVAKMAILYGSASVRGRVLTVTLTNPSLDSAVTTRVRLEGSRPLEVTGEVLTHDDRQASNTFARPSDVSLASLQATIDGASVNLRIPSKAVVALSIRMDGLAL